MAEKKTHLPVEIAELPQESQGPTQKFSTKPPELRTRYSGKFRKTPSQPLEGLTDEEISATEGKAPEEESLEEKEARRTQTILDFFSRMEEFRTKIVREPIGGVLLNEFEAFRTLPYCIRDVVIKSILEAVNNATEEYAGPDGEKRYNLPSNDKIEEIIIKKMFEKDGISLLKEELAKLIENGNSDDDKTAHEIEDRMVQWLEMPFVHLYLYAYTDTEASQLIADILGSSIREKAKRITPEWDLKHHPLPHIEVPPPSRKGEKDRS